MLPATPSAVLFTPRMEALLHVALPSGGHAERCRVLASALRSVDNNASLCERDYHAARRLAAEGTFRAIYGALQPHMPDMTTDERLGMWHLKGMVLAFEPQVIGNRSVTPQTA